MSDLRAEILAALYEREAEASAAYEGPWETRPADEDEPDGECAGIWSSDSIDDTVIVTDSGYYPPTMPTARFIAASRALVPQLLAALRAEVERHSRFGIYDECGHDHGKDYDNMDPKVHDIEAVGLVCDDGLIAQACRECYTDDGETRDNTDEGEWPCAFIERIHRATVGAS